MRTLDLPRLERFYCEVLGLKVLRRDDGRGSVWLALGGTVLMLERAAPGEALAAPGTRELLAFAVDDKEAWRARPGIAIEDETAHTLYFRDPDGRRIAVSDYALAPPLP